LAICDTAEDLETAFVSTDLNSSDGNLDQSARYPRILGKFAAVETLLASGEFEKAIPHAKFALDKRPRSALAHHYLGEALLGLGRYLEAADAFRASLGYDSSYVPALGNLGLTHIHLERRSVADL
jgi:tetratricopeptide (TPR) repeat protein